MEVNEFGLASSAASEGQLSIVVVTMGQGEEMP
jgi:hypothetical protein